MSCSNCYNGCTQITSDQCVRYTGIDVPVLGIKNGDSLSYVEQALIEFLVSTLDGSGIKIDLDQSFFCDIFSSNLPKCGDLTLVDVLNTLVKTVCVIQEEIIANGEAIVDLQNSVSEINGSYNFPANNCLGTLPTNPTTHDVVQAVVSTLCATIASLDGYVLLTELPTLIAQYITSQTTGGGNLMSNKMVPWAVYPYFNSDISGFDSQGRGSGIWEKVYLCNGLNGTPDLRGRVLVGATSGVPGGTMDSIVNPTPGSGNPDYSLSTKAGTNKVQLSIEQMPSHTHTATALVTPNPHDHAYKIGTTASNSDASGIPDFVGQTSALTEKTSLTVNVTNANTGQGQAHPNYQPGMGCYYIIYIP